MPSAGELHHEYRKRNAGSPMASPATSRAIALCACTESHKGKYPWVSDGPDLESRWRQERPGTLDRRRKGTHRRAERYLPQIIMRCWR